MNEKMTTRLMGLIQSIFSLLGLLIMIPVMTATYAYMNTHYSLWTTLFLLTLGCALLMGSKKRREAALHFIHQVIQMENLMMVEGEEARMLEQREKQTGETRSLDLWR